MTRHRDEEHPIEKLVEDVEFRQRNTTHPDVLINASSADELMWKGSARITKVQRIGVGLFGFVFLLAGISIVNAIYGQDGWWLSVPIGLAFVVVGCKLLWNSIRKNDSAKATKKEC
jgi:heme A synthase